MKESLSFFIEILKAVTYNFPEIIVESGNYVNDKKEGVFKYYKDRILVKQLVYNNDKLNGKALFFNKYGE